MGVLILCPLVACGMFASVPAGLCVMLLSRWFESLSWFLLFPPLWLIWTIVLTWVVVKAVM